MTPTRAVLVFCALAASAPLAAGGLRFTSRPALYAKGRVSSEFSEVKVTFSPDGARVLWGSTNRPGGPGGWDLWESRKEMDGWTAPATVTFNSPRTTSTPSSRPTAEASISSATAPAARGATTSGPPRSTPPGASTAPRKTSARE